MVQSKHFMSRLVQALILLGVAALLTACAGRPKPLDATTPFTVNEVRITTQSMADFGFADRLQQKLDATAGRATSDAGLASVLRIVVLDRSADVGPTWFFNASSESATLDIMVVDADTGQVLRSSIVQASAPGGKSLGAESVLIDRLVVDIRALLGLSGTAPHPVSGAKRAVARPQLRPDAGDADAGNAALMADPLLNGTVTPTTSDLGPAADPEPALDLSRPLLSPEPAETEEPLADDGVMPVEPVDMPSAFEVPAAAPTIPDDGAPAGTGDEPCIITLDKDCSDPDSQ
ncbi:hypothetical protein [Hoeflea sp.]|uniref:hypothetical protein n=1 Tax=Hoeflea sp. TaxID=1940281 RepID=UPI00198BCC48|nr:hypothetical protein [Hoeflea sp.]MBC7283981.1 hypothetical protein [Hoeflea sp.]